MTEKFSYKGKSICYTFRYGGAVPKKIYRGLAVFFCAFIGVFSAISVLLLARRQFSAAAVAAAAALFCLIPGAFFCVFDRWTWRIGRQIALWLSDEGLAEVRAVPFEYAARYDRKGRKVYRFGVTFEAGERKITRYSEIYDTFFANHRVLPLDVLYSPRHDEVMILREK